MSIKKNIPNAITCLHLLCGCLGIIFVFKNNTPLIYASYLIAIAALLDFADGFVARLLNVHSDIGKQLDSLADAVSFGVLPGMILFRLINIYENDTTPLSYIALLLPVFAVVRLANFNIDSRQTDSFIGLPTPAMAIFIASLPAIHIVYDIDLFLAKLHPMQAGSAPLFIQIGLSIFNAPVLASIAVFLSFLMVAKIPLFALKFKNFGWADNKIRYVFLGLALVLLLTLQVIAIPLIIVLYVLLSVLNNFFKKED